MLCVGFVTALFGRSASSGRAETNLLSWREKRLSTQLVSQNEKFPVRKVLAKETINQYSTQSHTDNISLQSSSLPDAGLIRTSLFWRIFDEVHREMIRKFYKFSIYRQVNNN